MLMKAAILLVCLAAHPDQCQRTEIRIEPKACHLPAYNAEFQNADGWTKARVQIVCR
jgi:hypothetical protein